MAILAVAGIGGMKVYENHNTFNGDDLLSLNIEALSQNEGGTDEVITEYINVTDHYSNEEKKTEEIRTFVDSLGVYISEIITYTRKCDVFYTHCKFTDDENDHCHTILNTPPVTTCGSWEKTND